MKMQTRLPTEKITKEEAKRIAYYYVREHYGTIPSIDEPIFENEAWKFNINANYPRVLFDTNIKKPSKVRFMAFKDLGEILISKGGNIISAPRYYDVRGGIKKKLEEVRNVIEKVLVKVCADKFSQLTFPDHMFTPIQDIISWLLIRDTLNLNEFLEGLDEDTKNKYLHNIKILESVGLVKKDRSLILPSDALVEIEMNKGLTTPKKLAAALTLFYERGYKNIDTIRSFLGPHLMISGFCYRESIEYGSIRSIKQNEFKTLILENYGISRLIKLPRYLLQLENIGIIEQTKNEAEIAWLPNKEVLVKLKGEEEIIGPLKEIFS